MTFLFSGIPVFPVRLIVVGFNAGFKVGGLADVKFVDGWVVEDVEEVEHRPSQIEKAWPHDPPEADSPVRRGGNHGPDG